MANFVLIILFIVLALVSFMACGYLVMLWSHPDEKDDLKIKVYTVIVVISNNQVLGFTSGIVQISLIPLDVNDARNEYGLSMYTAWMILLITNSILMILVVPFLQFYYETDHEASFVPSTYSVHSNGRFYLLIHLRRILLRDSLHHCSPSRQHLYRHLVSHRSRLPIGSLSQSNSQQPRTITSQRL